MVRYDRNNGQGQQSQSRARMAWAWHFLAAADAIPRRAPLAWLLAGLEEIAMTLREDGHITKDGWILILMACTAILMAASVWLGVWTFYAPVSKEAFNEYKEGMKASVANLDQRLNNLDQRLNRMEGKLDSLGDYLRGLSVPTHGRP